LRTEMDCGIAFEFIEGEGGSRLVERKRARIGDMERSGASETSAVQLETRGRGSLGRTGGSRIPERKAVSAHFLDARAEAGWGLIFFF
jgi:hypothetical protein